MPSVDVMMDSAIQAFGAEVIGVLLTGMGDDGANAMVHIRDAGGQTIAEAESTCIVFGMPAQAIERGGADWVLPSHDIADKIVALVMCTV
jgi:two-component system chemotaxis response regulator CheB